jgi:hypothetical protein
MNALQASKNTKNNNLNAIWQELIKIQPQWLNSK